MLINGGERGGSGGWLEPVGESMLPRGGVMSDKSSLEPLDEAGQDTDRGERNRFQFQFKLFPMLFLSFIISTEAFLGYEQTSFITNNHVTTT